MIRDLNLKIGYIILAHRYPAQLRRLVQRLQHHNAFFFIHIDKNAPIFPFQQALEFVAKDRLFFVPRERGYWGRLGIVLGTIHGIKAVVEQKMDYAILLSGQDYPIKSNDNIYNFISNNYGKSYIQYEEISAESPQHLLDRINRYYFRFPDLYSFKLYTKVYPSVQPHSGMLSKMVDTIIGLRFSKNRLYPKGLKAYKGFQWWVLHHTALKYILSFLKNRPDYINFHRWSLLPDEMFFQGILINAQDEALLTSIVNDDLKYVDWDKPTPPRPAVLKNEDFDQLKNIHHLFARKFDATVDTSILDRIDRELL